MIITSHVASELERLSDRVGILIGGKLVALGTVAELCQIVGHRTVVELRVSRLQPEAVDSVRRVAGVVQLASMLHAAGTGRLHLHLTAEQTLENVLSVLRAEGTSVHWVGTAPAGLEEAFFAYTGSALA